MIEFARNIFWSFFTEIFFVVLAIALKDDKRKVVTILVIGTLVSGIIGFGQPIYLYVIENIPTLSNISFPKPSLQSQVAEKINTIYSYKAHGTEVYTDDKGKVVTIQIDEEFVRPNKLHSIEKSEDGQITEIIFVGNPYCTRQGSGAWSCNTGSVSDDIQEWGDIVMGKRSFGLNTINVVDHSSRTETWNGKECYLFYKTQTVTYDPNSHAEETYGLCVDSNTLLPVKYTYKGNWPDNPGTKIANRVYNLFDINVPIDISLPASP